MIKIISFWPRPLVLVSRQTKLENHREDSISSQRCPVYVKPIKEAFFLSFPEDVEMEWMGGRDLRLSVPSWWQESYNSMRMRWLEDASGELGEKTFLTRYHGDSPLGAVGSCSGHAGGLVANFFTGLSIRTEPGVKCFVSHSFNTFSPVVTMQDGIYDTDTFPGEFSVNFQFLLQNRVVKYQAGEPFAALFFFREVESSEFEIAQYGSKDWSDQWNRSLEFYLAKGKTGCPYHRNPVIKSA